MKKVGVALLGLGVVGGGTYTILRDKHDYIAENEGIDIEIRCVLEKNLDRARELGVDPAIVTTDIERVLGDPDIAVVAEFVGGIEPARTFLIRSLEAGKSIVTANKARKCSPSIGTSWRRLPKRAAAGFTSKPAARAASPSSAPSPTVCRATPSLRSRA